jgi:hypothetical protein
MRTDREERELPEGEGFMGHSQRIGRRRFRVLAALALPATIAALVAGAALSAGAEKPTMEVLPKPTGLQYGQTVTIKAHHLPKGSGSVAATICGLVDAAGKTIASPTAKDCAGAAELGKLVVLKSWQSNGEFETQYTLPQRGQAFGENKRLCDKSHHCALVVADANPDNPAYHVDTVIQFVDQQPFGATPTTTQKTSTTTPSGADPTTPGKTADGGTGDEGSGGNNGSAPPGVTADYAADADGDPQHPRVHLEGRIGIHPPTGGASALPAPSSPGDNAVPPEAAQALDQVCTQLAAAVTQAGGDPSGLHSACAAAMSGSGPQQFAALLQAPGLLCAQGSSAWQENPQITDACNQAAAAIAPNTSQLGGALAPAVDEIG